MLDEKIVCLNYTDIEGNKQTKWVNEFAVFPSIKRLEENGCTNISIGETQRSGL